MSSITVRLPVTRSDDTDYIMISRLDDYIKQNLKNLVLTSPGEKIMDASFGVGLKDYLFENITDSLVEDIKSNIIEQTARYMPFLEIIDVFATDPTGQNFNNGFMNSLDLSIKYYVPAVDLAEVLQLSVR